MIRQLLRAVQGCARINCVASGKRCLSTVRLQACIGIVDEALTESMDKAAIATEASWRAEEMLCKNVEVPRSGKSDDFVKRLSVLEDKNGDFVKNIGEPQ